MGVIASSVAVARPGASAKIKALGKPDVSARIMMVDAMGIARLLDEEQPGNNV